MKANHQETLRLLRRIDDRGKRLTPEEIDFVASLIDANRATFTGGEVLKIKAIYGRRVRRKKKRDDL